MRRSLLFSLAALAILLGGLALTGRAADKIKIEKLDDLPRHTYRIAVKAAEVPVNPEALAALAAAVKADLLADLERYEIPDATTIKNYHSDLGAIALLEADFAAYETHIAAVRDLEDKEAQKLTTGLTGRAYAAAMAAPEAQRPEAYRTAYAALVNALPYDVVEAQLRSTKGMAEMMSENLVLGLAESKYQPLVDSTGGVISKDVALSLLKTATMLRTIIPYRESIAGVIDAYLAAHAVDKPDIWAERQVALSGSEGGQPVLVTIWDSGLDTEIPAIAQVLWTNADETPGNGSDDDGNGFVDDVHGIAYTLHSDKTPDLLYPIGEVGAERPRLQRQMKGLTDISMAVDSKEAAELKQELSGLQQAEAQTFIQNIALYGNYCHGTHVAGIAMAGNPYIRLMPSRLTFGYTLVPEKPTLEQARKDSAAADEAIAYYRKHGVRVVNMSWGGSLASVEQALEAHNAGGTPEERRELARQIFEIGRSGLYAAMQNTPEILYVTAAGNEDNDVKFEEVIPSAFDLPNIIVVGAVDQAGDETGFTSFGNVDCYANGFEVESFVPGGDRMKLSGTSQASPQVVNLAAKVLALKPELTPAQVRELILSGCDEKQVGDRAVKLINPKKTMGLATPR
ncbi:MAG TPA: S8 family serine peptidase [candidate division Zixibacteria bacterium]|mgnify:CR=1 FL=1|nr:S8 family serine peptidase [candidate division Zixibacteria bacterium]MDD4917016.1 S8 family serine peptidase [candidate division Zixibacteria bacterium]MDM7971424.1 S8 family serine peptidase [candidate division Zixibacteria bacterium]HOD66633.1 S8 family serine peptidase [candidate division Zixibacteria bacterium]HPC10686.1 S8 family serine peptidase [candidate division Zixibacteria bacterium]